MRDKKEHFFDLKVTGMGILMLVIFFVMLKVLFHYMF